VDAKAHRVFWPSAGNVTIERNVYFGTSAPLKGEEEDSPEGSSEQATDPSTPTYSTPIDQPDLGDQLDRSNLISPSVTNEDSDEDDEPEQPKSPAPLHRSSRIQKPSCILRDLQSRAGVAPTHSAPLKIVPPPQIEEVPDED